MIEVYNSVVTFLVLFAILGWIISLGTKNVTHVDSMWSIFFVIAMAVVAVNQTEITDRHIAFIMALLLWASRLSIYLTIRNWGAPEDIRYRNIRANN